MKYNLIGENDITDIKKSIFKNRGVEDIAAFVNPSDEHVFHWSLLDGMKKALLIFLKHGHAKSRIHIIIDSVESPQ